MSDVKTVAEIMNELKKRYDKNKRGWRVMAGKDGRGRYDMIFSHGGKVWQLKMEKVKPYQYVGYGALVGELDEHRSKKLMVGKPLIFQLLSPQTDGSLIMARGIEKFSSKAIRDLKTVISREQRELELRLSEELDKLIRRHYPELLTYV
jgi:hypothetical protein